MRHHNVKPFRQSSMQKQYIFYFKKYNTDLDIIYA